MLGLQKSWFLTSVRMTIKLKCRITPRVLHGPNRIRASLTSVNIGVVNLGPSEQSHNQVIIGYRSRLTRSGKRLLPMRPEARYQPAGTLFTIDSTSPLLYNSFDVSCRCTTKAVPRQSSMISCKLPF